MARDRAPADTQLTAYLVRVHEDNGRKSLRAIGEAMRLAHSRVSAILHGALPADETQTRLLVEALGGGTDEVREAVRLFRAARSGSPRRRSGRVVDRVDEMIASALTGHWEPIATGGSDAPGPGFVGRDSLLLHLDRWLTSPHDPRPRVVTGGPGSGKSAVLARTVLAAQNDGSGDRRVVAAVHARGLTLTDTVAVVARQYGVDAADAGDLVRLLRDRREPSLLVVDAVEEAGEVEPVLTELLRPLVREASNGRLRLLVGARRHLIRRLGARWITVLDLDGDFADARGLGRYVAAVLTAHPGSVYATIPDRATRVARAVATRAKGSFLIGRLTGMALALRPTVATDLAALPDSVIAAMEAYLDAIGGDQRVLEELLRPLAFAEGVGLPRDLWVLLANELCGLPGKYGPDDLERLFASAAASFLSVGREGGADSRPMYRLFHDALAQAVSEIIPASPEAPASRPAARLAIARALRGTVVAAGGSLDWSTADPYVRRHLATHAADTPLLSLLVADPRYLLHADVDRLLAALTHGVTGAAAVANRTVYELVADRLGSAPRGERAAYLALSGLQHGTSAIADALVDEARAASWWPVAATWAARVRHRILYRHDDVVNAVCVARLDAEALVVSGDDDGQLRIRSVSSRGGDEGSADLGTPVMALTELFLDGLPAVVAGGEDGHLYVLDVPTLDLLARSAEAHPVAINALLVLDGADGPTVVSGDMAGALRRWTAVPTEPLGPSVPVGDGEISGLCSVSGRVLSCGAPNSLTLHDDGLHPVDVLFAGRPAPTSVVAVHAPDERVVSGHDDGSVRIFDGTSGELLATVDDVQNSYISALTVSGSQVVCGGEAGLLSVVDVNDPDPTPVDLPGHDSPVQALAATAVGDRRIVVSAAEDRCVRQWDLETGDGTVGPDDVGVTGLVRIGRRTLAVRADDRSVQLREFHTHPGDYLGRRVEISPGVTLMTGYAVTDLGGELTVALGDSDGVVAIEPVGDGSHGHRFPAHEGWVADLAFAWVAGEPVVVTVGHDDRLLVSAVADGRAVVPATELPLVRGTVSGLALVPHADGLWVAVSTTGGQLTIWDPVTRRRVTAAELPEPRNIADLDADEHTVVGGTLTGWTFSLPIEGGELAVRRSHFTGVSAMTIGGRSGAPVVVSGAEDGDVTIAAVDGTALASLSLGARVQSVLLDEHGQLAVATSRGVAVVDLSRAGRATTWEPPTAAEVGGGLGAE